VARRGYFVEGLGGAQFALGGAVERLRGQGDPEDDTTPLVLAATDPAQPFGGILPWPKRDTEQRSPQRVSGAYVVIAGGDPVLYLERAGKGLVTLVDADDARMDPALGALADEVREGRIKRIGIERVDGEPVHESAFHDRLVEHGFRQGPRRLTLSA
jgi:ATP-dependent helicase Lhr and Lhr-like helicase